MHDDARPPYRPGRNPFGVTSTTGRSAVLLDLTRRAGLVVHARPSSVMRSRSGRPDRNAARPGGVPTHAVLEAHYTLQGLWPSGKWVLSKCGNPAPEPRRRLLVGVRGLI